MERGPFMIGIVAEVAIGTQHGKSLAVDPSTSSPVVQYFIHHLPNPKYGKNVSITAERLSEHSSSR